MRSPRRTASGLAAILLGAAALGGGGCFHHLDGHGLLGSQGRASQPRLLFQRWKVRVTSTDPWEYKPAEGSVVAASDDGERLFVGGRTGVFVCVDAKRGKVVWKRKLGAEIRSEALFHEGRLFVGATDGQLHALDAESGKVTWSYNVKAEVTARPVLSGDRVYVTTAEHAVYALDADSGEWRWSYTRSVPEGFTLQGQGGVLLHKGSIYAGFADGFLVSLKAADGALQWEKKLSSAARFADVDSTPVLGAGAVLASSFPEGLFALDADDGLIRWKIPARGASTPAIAGGTGYVTTPSGEVVAFEVASGKVTWRSQLREREVHVSEPVLFRRYLIVATSEPTRLGSEGGVWVLDKESGKLDSVVDLGPGVHGKPLVAGGNLYFLTDSGWLYAYRFGRN